MLSSIIISQYHIAGGPTINFMYVY